MKDKLQALLGQLERMSALAEERDPFARKALPGLFAATIGGVKALIEEAE